MGLFKKSYRFVTYNDKVASQIQKITDQKRLMEIAIEAKDILIVEEALNHITDDYYLYEIYQSKYTSNINTKAKALDRIKDQEIFKKMIQELSPTHRDLRKIYDKIENPPFELSIQMNSKIAEDNLLKDLDRMKYPDDKDKLKEMLNKMITKESVTRVLELLPFEEDNTNTNIITYTVPSENGLATAIFQFEEGHNFTLNMDDILPLTPEEVQTTYGIDKSLYSTILETIKTNVKPYGDILSLYSITIDEDDFGYSDALTLKINLTEKMKEYDSLQFVYLDDENNFAVTDVKNFFLTSVTADVDLDHLSAYALVGKKKEESNNPNNNTNNPGTGDSILFYVSILGLSILGFGISRYYLKKN